MSKFYCREDELRKMNKRYKGDKFECIVIYGRRRVGKTALINEFCKDNTTIYWNRSLEIKVILQNEHTNNMSIKQIKRK